jgi:Cu-Zn family superoxide dismutase
MLWRPSAIPAALIVGMTVAACSDNAVTQYETDAVFGAWPIEFARHGQGKGRFVRAEAKISGPDGIRGVVQFREPLDGDFPEPTVEVVARIKGPRDALAPGAHGLHLHENGVCEPPFTSAGGHFDPGPFGSSLPVDDNHPYHLGDVPNLVVDRRGRGELRHVTSRVTLSEGPLSLIDANGSAVIVHLNPDQGMPGVAGASGGPRIACGVIELLGG